MLFLNRKHDHHHEDDHDDHGGLHRDLLETNAAMDRRGMLRMAARFGVALGAVQLIGVLLNLELTIVSASTCTPLADYAVYLWHSDRAGLYSLYSAGVTNQNYLRGVQAADSAGKVTFTSIFPACYSGRWPHIHFEVYPSLAAATSVANKVATSPIALPKATCDLVYATTGYAQSLTNLSQVSLASDMVFSDGSSLELATITGSLATGFTASLSVAI